MCSSDLVMVVGFVNAGLMSLTQSIGVIFGDNIGTTITGWIISVKVGKYSLLLIGLGIFPLLFSKREKLKQGGQLLFALGMVFLGLSLMSGAFKPLRSDESFLHMMQFFSADSYFSLMATVGVGCLLTFFIQSSSAMLAITIALASTGAITFQTALALVMGENIGTTITAILASVGATTAAKRASAAHAVFNVFGVLVITSIFWIYKDFIELIIGGAADFVNEKGEKPNIAAHIAAGHTVFNVANVILFVPFLGQLEKIVKLIVKDKGKKEIKKLEFFGSISNLSPALAIGQARAELIKMSDIVSDVLENTKIYLNGKVELQEHYKKVNKLEDITDRIQYEMTIFLGKVMEVRLTSEETNKVKAILRMADELESIADYSASIVKYAKRAYEDNLDFDEQTKAEIERLSIETTNVYEKIKEEIKALNPLDEKIFKSEIQQINNMANEIKEAQLERSTNGSLSPQANLTLSDIIVSFRRIKNHMVNLLEAYQGGKHL